MAYSNPSNTDSNASIQAQIQQFEEAIADANNRMAVRLDEANSAIVAINERLTMSLGVLNSRLDYQQQQMAETEKSLKLFIIEALKAHGITTTAVTTAAASPTVATATVTKGWKENNEEKSTENEVSEPTVEEKKQKVDSSDFFPVTDPNLKIMDEEDKVEKEQESKTDSFSTSPYPKTLLPPTQSRIGLPTTVNTFLQSTTPYQILSLTTSNKFFAQPPLRKPPPLPPEFNVFKVSDLPPPDPTPSAPKPPQLSFSTVPPPPPKPPDSTISMYSKREFFAAEIRFTGKLAVISSDVNFAPSPPPKPPDLKSPPNKVYTLPPDLHMSSGIFPPPPPELLRPPPEPPDLKMKFASLLIVKRQKFCAWFSFCPKGFQNHQKKLLNPLESWENFAPSDEIFDFSSASWPLKKNTIHVKPFQPTKSCHVSNCLSITTNQARDVLVFLRFSIFRAPAIVLFQDFKSTHSHETPLMLIHSQDATCLDQHLFCNLICKSQIHVSFLDLAYHKWISKFGPESNGPTSHMPQVFVQCNFVGLFLIQPARKPPYLYLNLEDNVQVNPAAMIED